MMEKKKKLFSTAPSGEKIAKFNAFLEAQGALDPLGIDISGENSFADAIMVAGATSRRHAQGLADGIARICQEQNYEFLGMEGYEQASWILVDCNDVVVNIFQEDMRQLYRLEDLWSGARPSQKKEILP